MLALCRCPILGKKNSFSGELGPGTKSETKYEMPKDGVRRAKKRLTSHVSEESSVMLEPPGLAP